MALNDGTKKQIEDLIGSNKVMLFMKGNKNFPQCGFSSTVVSILKELGVPFETANVLADADLRQGIKEFSDWPTIPQLYVNGEFLGGCDIVREMHATGELAQAVGVELKPPKVPTVTITDGAAKAFRDATEPGDTDPLRLEIANNFAVDLYFGPAKAGDFTVESNGIKIAVDPASAKRADGVVIDYVETPDGAGFRIDNPNEPPRVKVIGPNELKEWRDQGKAHKIVDVRTDGEIAKAKIDGSLVLEEHKSQIDALPKDTVLVFLCHHGVRSQAAAEQFLSRGYTNVFNLKGGIDGWSQVVDKSVPRY